MKNNLLRLELDFLTNDSSDCKNAISFLIDYKQDFALHSIDFCLNILKSVNNEKYSNTSISEYSDNLSNIPDSFDSELNFLLLIVSDISDDIPKWFIDLNSLIQEFRVLKISYKEKELESYYKKISNIANFHNISIINKVQEKPESSEEHTSDEFKNEQKISPEVTEDENKSKVPAEKILIQKDITDSKESKEKVPEPQTVLPSKSDIIKDTPEELKDNQEDELQEIQIKIEKELSNEVDTYSIPNLEVISTETELSDDLNITEEVTVSLEINEPVKSIEDLSDNDIDQEEISIISELEKIEGLISDGNIDEALSEIELSGESIEKTKKIELYEKILEKNDSSVLINELVKCKLEICDTSEIFDYLKILYLKTNSKNILKALLSRLLDAQKYISILDIYEEVFSFSDEKLSEKAQFLLKKSEEKSDFQTAKSLYETCMKKWSDQDIFNKYIIFLAKNNDFKSLISISNKFIGTDNAKVENIVNILDEYRIENLQVLYLKLTLFELTNDLDSFSKTSLMVLSLVNDIQLGKKTLNYFFKNNNTSGIRNLLSVITDIDDYADILFEKLDQCTDFETFINIANRLCENSELERPDVYKKVEIFLDSIDKDSKEYESILSSLSDFYSKNGDFLASSKLLDSLKSLNSSEFDMEKYTNSLIESEQYSNVIDVWGKNLTEDELLRKLEYLLLILENKKNAQPISEVMECICELEPEFHNYKKYCLIMIKSGNFPIADSIIRKIFYSFDNSSDFCLNAIRNIKSEGYFPSSSKEILINILLKLRLFDELNTELSRWGELFFSDIARRNEILKTCIKNKNIIPLLNILKKNIPGSSYKSILKSTYIIAKDVTDFSTTLFVSKALMLKDPDIEFINNVLDFFIKNNRYENSTAILRLVKDPWVFKRSTIKTWENTKDEDLFWIIIKQYSASGETSKIKSISKLQFNDELDFLDELKSKGLKHIYLNLLKDSDTPSSSYLKDLIDSSDWEAVYTITKRIFEKEPDNNKNYRLLLNSISKLKNAKNFRGKIIEFAEKSFLDVKIDIYICIDEFDLALDVCNSMIDSMELPIETIFEKLDELKFKRYLKEHKYDPYLSLSLSKLYLEKNEIAKACMEMETYLSSFPNDSRIAYDLCQLYIRSDQYEKALPYIKRLLKSCPDEPKYITMSSKINNIVTTNKMFTLK